MSERLLAGPALFTPSLHPAAEWLAATDQWLRWARRLSLRLVATPEYWARLADCGCSPTLPLIRELLSRAGLASAVPSAMTLVAGLVAFTEAAEWEGMIVEWKASGCLTTRVDRRIAEEIVAASSALGVGASNIAGGALRDVESVHVSVLQSAPPESADLFVSLSCHPTPDSYVDTLDPVDHADDLRLAIDIASARLSRVSRVRTYRFEVLPQLSPSLEPLDLNLKRGVIETMAVLLLPWEARPSGLEEHQLRTGPGPNEPTRRGRRGAAWRVDLKMHGVGWRLHFWRGEDGVTFSNVTSEDSFAIFE